MYCTDIGIGEEWYGIASGIIHSEITQLWPLIHVQNAFLLNILRMNRRISIKFWICIDIYIYDLHLSNYILLFLIFQPSYGPYVQNVFLPNIFQINDYISRKVC